MTRLIATRLTGAVFILALGSLSQGASADENSGPYVELFGGASFPRTGHDSTSVPPNGITSTTATVTSFDADFDKGPLFGGAVGYAAGPARLELEGHYLTDKIKDPGASMLGGDKFKATTAMLNAWFDIGHYSIRPYAGLGLGAIFETIGSNDKTDAAAQIGAGVNWYLTRRLNLDLGYRYLTTERMKYNYAGDGIASGFHDQQVILGIRFTFLGEAPPPVVEPVVVPATPACSDTPNPDGTVLPGCKAVDETPPPVCKSPLPGEKISLDGCGTGDIIVLRGVNFDFDKSTLTADAKLILDGLTSELEAYPNVKIQLAGHTDSKGTDAYNQKLSTARAESVLAYFVGKGISADRMTAVGYGATRPVADNATDEGREENRRVELEILSSTAN